jgi:hypothetical protein
MSLSARLVERHVLPQALFHRALAMEQKRAERSHNRFVLMVIEARTPAAPDDRRNLVDKLAPVILRSVRETDIVGWHIPDSGLGVIFAELGPTDIQSALNALRAKMRRVLTSVLPADEANRVAVTFYCHRAARTEATPELSGESAELARAIPLEAGSVSVR